jgi:hypothetical protein
MVGLGGGLPLAKLTLDGELGPASLSLDMRLSLTPAAKLDRRPGMGLAARPLFAGHREVAAQGAKACRRRAPGKAENRPLHGNFPGRLAIDTPEPRLLASLRPGGRGKGLPGRERGATWEAQVRWGVRRPLPPSLSPA